MKKIFRPTKGPEDWKQLLAEPQKHWKTGFSAKALAYCWEQADGFPESVKTVFRNSGAGLFENVKLVTAFPEYQVPLPPDKGHPSQNDIFVLANGKGQLISIMVEGKVSESFGETVSEWIKDNSKGKQERLNFLLNKLQLKDAQIQAIRYQLLHRTASAIIMAEKFAAKNALMLVHSFSQTDKWFEDYAKFLALFRLKAEINSMAGVKNINGIDLYFSWVRGEEKYLNEEFLTSAKPVEQDVYRV